MWAVTVCPDCGEHIEVDLEKLTDRVFCHFCRETFELAEHELARLHRDYHRYYDDVNVPAVYYTSNTVDSSVWLG